MNSFDCCQEGFSGHLGAVDLAQHQDSKPVW